MSDEETSSTFKHSSSATRPRRGLAIALAAIMIGAAFVGIAPATSAQTSTFSDDFNDGTIDTSKWTVAGGSENADCGYSSSPYALQFSGDTDRYAETVYLDVTSGGSLGFTLKIGTGSSPCENADSNEEVGLQYSTDGGNTWSAIATYDTDSYGSFTSVSEVIPSAAETSATKFRWIQATHSGSSFDHWAIDDVSIPGTVSSPSEPSSPRNLDAQSSTTPGEIDLTWDPPSDNGGLPINDYVIYRSQTQGGPYNEIARTGGSTSYTDSGLIAGEYYYRVGAINGVGEGPMSNEASACSWSPDELCGLSTPANPLGTRANPDGTCTIYDDRDQDGEVDSGEEIATLPCPSIGIHHHRNGAVTIYDDENRNGEMDPGEEIFTTPVTCDTATLDANLVPFHPFNLGCWDDEAQQPPGTPPVEPETTDNDDGTCTVWNDEDRDGVQDDGEDIGTLPCPDVKTRGNEDGSTTIYDDKNDNGQVDEGEELATTPVVDLRTADNPDGTCTVWNDDNQNDTQDDGEEVATIPCPDIKTRSNDDGTTTIYDDKNDNDQVDDGEELATTPVVDLQTTDNPDGTCTVWNDEDQNDTQDEGEEVTTAPCPNPQTATRDDGSIAIYDDKDDDDQEDDNETLATFPPGGVDLPPVNPSDAGANQSVPAQETPPVEPQNVTTPAIPGQNVSTPPIVTPPTCEVEPCGDNTTLVPAQNESTPRVPGQNESTPSHTVPEQCTPFETVCVDEFTVHSQNVSTPPVESENVSTDPVIAPPVCSTGDELCLGPVTVVPGQNASIPGIPSQNQSTPPVPAQQVTPETTISVQVVNTTANATDLAATHPMGPTNVTVDTPLTSPITVTICQSPSPVCQQPVAPSFTAHTEVQVYLQVGEDTYTTSVPIDFDQN